MMLQRQPLLCQILVLLGALAAEPPAIAQTVHYADNLATCDGLVPCHPSIMGAVAAAGANDTIEVFPGVYYESLTIKDKPGLVLKAHRRGLMPLIGSLTIEGSPGVQILHLALGSYVEVYGSSGVLIQGNVGRGTGIWFSSCGSTIRDNTLPGGVIRADRAGGCLVEGNRLGRGIFLGAFSGYADYNTVRNNVLGGGIHLGGERVRGNSIVSNQIDGGGISISGGAPRLNYNLVHRNVVRGGGIHLAGGLGGNLVTLNAISGSAGDGISVRNTTSYGGKDIIRLNTSVGNAGCDLNDASYPSNQNIWEKNRFGTRCGAATE